MRLEQDGGGDGEAEGPGNLEINDQIECGRLLDWQIGGFGAFQDLVSQQRPVETFVGSHP